MIENESLSGSSQCDTSEYEIPFPDRFAAVARRDNVRMRSAIRDEDGRLTYGELLDTATRIAAFLVRRGLTPGSGVAVLLHDNRLKVAALLGSMMAGGVWTPLDTKQPRERLRSMLASAGSGVLLCGKENVEEGRFLLWSCPELRFLVVMDATEDADPVDGDGSGELWEFFAVDARSAIEVSGWKDAWTGRWLSKEVMDEHADSVVARVLAALPQGVDPGQASILEVGCGSGLVMRRLAPLCGSYCGVDIAPTAVRRAMAEAEEMELDNVSFHTLSASRLGELEEKPSRYDAILFSSVVQGFPGLGYLERIQDMCLKLLAPSGALVLCDVWDPHTRDDWERSLLEYAATRKAPDETTIIPGDENLFVPRDFLRHWAIRNGMDVTFQRSDSSSWEMKPYVYDAVFMPGNNDNGRVSRTSKGKEVFFASDLERDNGTADLPELNPGDPAYIFFTSGSTGVPKGVCCSHANLANLTVSCHNRFAPRLTEEEALRGFCLGYPFHFDACLIMTLSALGYGYPLHAPSETALADPAVFAAYVLNARPAVMETTPSRGAMIVSYLEKSAASLDFCRVFGFGGEVLPPALLDTVYRLPGTGGVWVFNGYGPTECTVASTMYFMRSGTWRQYPFIPLGEATDNTEILLLNDRQKPVPVGMVGELVVAGAAVGMGYLNAPEENALRFITLMDETGARRAYRSGDMARRRADGALEFVRRKDGQMKVQGYRLEKQDVIEALLRCVGVVQAAIKLSDFFNDGVPVLAAYVVMNSSVPFDPGSLREQLLGRLPEYAVPGWFVRVDSLPLGPNGKLDESRLPNPVGETDEVRVRPPAGGTEKRLVPLWGGLLGLAPERLDAEASFFTQGGYSLMVLRLLGRVHDEFGVHVPVAEFFKKPTLRDLALCIDRLEEGNGGDDWSALVAARKEGDGPPLCCFHPVGGDILCYRRLAELLPPKWPVYMLQCPGLEEGGTPVDSIESLAHMYADALRREFPDGKRALTMFGWSMGGLTAWEAAGILREEGYVIETIILVDMPAKNDSLLNVTDLEDPESMVSLFTGVIPLDADELRGMTPARRIEHVLDKGRKTGLYPADMSVERISRLFAVYAANGRAVRSYRLRPQDLRALLIRPRAERDAALPYMPSGGPDDYGWSEYALGGVTLRWVGGGHNNILQDPQVADVVGHVTRCLEGFLD